MTREQDVVGLRTREVDVVPPSPPCYHDPTPNSTVSDCRCLPSNDEVTRSTAVQGDAAAMESGIDRLPRTLAIRRQST